MESPADHGRVGLVLSGGGARGFAHIGVLRVLERAGAQFDVIAGTSMGAILGAFYASGRRADDLFQLADTTSWRDVVDLSLQTGLFKGDRLQAFLADHLPATFEELEVPLAVTTTDIETGEGVVHMEGDLIRAVRASSSFPGAFEPIQLAGRTLADGGIVNNLPVSAATLLGATRCIASDVTVPRRSVYGTSALNGNWWERMVQTVRLERRTPMAQMLFRTSDIMQSILVDIQYSLHPADLRIRLDMPEVRVESFREFRTIVRYGEETAERALDAVGGLDALLTPPRSDTPERTVTKPRRSGAGTR
ncbi:MAG: patatin-like phospholipase family protein [Deinococcales bacterium]